MRGKKNKGLMIGVVIAKSKDMKKDKKKYLMEMRGKAMAKKRKKKY